jgi:hypothetical protein
MSCNFGGQFGQPFQCQGFLALDTGHIIIRHQWVALLMLLAVIDCGNLLGQHGLAILTLTNQQGHHIGDSNPQNANFIGTLDDNLIIIHPAVEIPGVDTTMDPAEIAGVDPDFDDEPTGVDMGTDAWAIDTDDPVDNNAIAIDGLKQQDPTEGVAAVLTAEPTTSSKKVKSPVKKVASPKTWMAAQDSRARKAREKYVPNMKGNKYAIAFAQITLPLQGSKDTLCMAQRLVKLMGKGLHRCTDIVGMVMAQVSMKAALKKWGKAAEQAIAIKMRQLHWRNSYKPMHWHELTKGPREHILESHIFIEEKQDGKIKARKVVQGNKQQDYITKEDVSSPMILAESVMLTCMINALEDQDIAVIDIPNAFFQTLVEDEEHSVIVRIRGPLVDILVSIAPDVYGPYMSTNKAGQKVLLVQCLNAVYGTMVAALLYYKKFVKSLMKQGYKINLYDGCMANKVVKRKQVTICFHIDDCKISHKSSAVLDNTIAWLRVKYKSIFEDGLGQMKVHRGKTHKYLGMSLKFSHKGQCQVTMHDHIDGILKAYKLAIKDYNNVY